MSERLPLRGRTALVTGVSRRRGIGFAVARRFAALGASVFIQHFRPHDEAQPWGADDLDDVRTGIREVLTDGAMFGDAGVDLRDASTIDPLIDAATALTGSLDILVCNQAASGDDGSILDVTAESLDRAWQTNARASLLLTAAFARQRTGTADAPRRPGDELTNAGPFERPTGHVFWLTSGQWHGPMPGEVAYATSKAALAGVTTTVAHELLRLGVVLNTIDPGPVNTGYLDPDGTDRDLSWVPGYLAKTPFGRFGRPEDPASLIGWLATDEGSWVVGQVLSSDGGFRIH